MSGDTSDRLSSPRKRCLHWRTDEPCAVPWLHYNANSELYVYLLKIGHLTEWISGPAKLLFGLLLCANLGGSELSAAFVRANPRREYGVSVPAAGSTWTESTVSRAGICLAKFDLGIFDDGRVHRPARFGRGRHGYLYKIDADKEWTGHAASTG